MLSDYQLKIAFDFNIFINNAKKYVPNFFYKEKYELHCKNLQLFLRPRLKIKSTSCIRIWPIKMTKIIYRYLIRKKE